MSSLVNGYLTGAERELDIIIKESDAKFMKLNALYDMVDTTIEADFLAAEATVMKESGTYDDLTDLYTEAVEKGAEKKRGIIGTIINGIMNLIDKIKNSVLKIFGKDGSKMPNPEGNAKAPQETEEKVGMIKKLASAVKSFISHPIDAIKGLFSGSNGKLIAAVTAFGALGGTLVVVKRKQIRKWISELCDSNETIKGFLAKVENLPFFGKKEETSGTGAAGATAGGGDNSGEGKTDDGKNKDEGLWKKIANALGTAVKWVGNAISSLLPFLKKGKGKTEDTAGKATGEEGGEGKGGTPEPAEEPTKTEPEKTGDNRNEEAEAMDNSFSRQNGLEIESVNEDTILKLGEIMDMF